MEVVGMFKNEFVFLRRHIRELHSVVWSPFPLDLVFFDSSFSHSPKCNAIKQERWMEKGRDVKFGEEPIKSAKSRSGLWMTKEDER